MFITKKHLPRRTFLRGLGVTMALPLLDAMIPAGTALAQTAAGAEVARGIHLFPAWSRDESVDAGEDGNGLGVHADPQAARSVQEANDDHQRTGEQGRDRAAGSRAQSGHVAERCGAAQDPGSLGRQNDRPDGGRQDRTGDALPFARSRY